MRLQRYQGNIWVLATAPATLWAAQEIILGSFMHNLRIPFSGSILTFFSVGLIAGFLQIWPYKGLIWRAGLIAALLKSVSPSHIILGPMIGIMTEALLMEMSVRLLGQGMPGLMLGGILSMNASLFHKIVNLLIMYGWNIAGVYLNLFRWLAKQTGWKNADPAVLFVVIPLAYALAGVWATWIGYQAGQKADSIPASHPSTENTNLTPYTFFQIPRNLHPIPALIIVHLMILAATFLLLGLHLTIIGIILSLAYFVFAGIRYNKYLRRFRKPALWLQFAIIVAITLAFGTSLAGPEHNLEVNLMAGFVMVLRAAMLITALTCILAELHSPFVRMLASKSKMKNLIQAVETAAAGIPWILNQLPPPAQAIRHPMRTLTTLLALTVQLNEKTSQTL